MKIAIALLAAALVVATPAAATSQPAEGAFVAAAERGLTRQERANLVLLAEVWGFTKYHHPAAVTGKRDWDAELLKLLSRMVEARSTEAAASVLGGWLDGLGPVAPCDPCAAPPEDLHLQSPVPEWLGSGRVPASLVPRLRHIFENRPAVAEQHYLVPRPHVGNPSFPNESGEEPASAEDPRQRMLALFRYWNAIRYWFPYRHLIGRPWDAVLSDYVARFAEADDAGAYRQLLKRLATEIGDGHSGVRLAPPPEMPGPSGEKPAAASAPTMCRLPVSVRFVADRLIVDGVEAAAEAAGVRKGDVILAIGGMPVPLLYDLVGEHIAASNEVWRRRLAAPGIRLGTCETVRLDVDRQGEWIGIDLARQPLKNWRGALPRDWHDRPGETFQMIGDVAYLKLSTIEAEDVPGYIDRARSAVGLVIDMRSYPGDFVPFAIGTYLVDKPTPFAAFTKLVPDTPGAFAWRDGTPIPPAPPEERYTKPVVLLVDDVTVSSPEYTAMAFEAAGATIVGSTTAGADGNVSSILLPTGDRMGFTGIGVFYPDRRPTQRIGIVPDIFVRPTAAGIAAGRDEVLERAIQVLKQCSVGESC